MAKFCPNCGKELNDNAVFCPQCGAGMQNNNQTLSTEKKSNSMAVAGFVLSFLFALLGLIFSILGLKKSKETNSGKGLSIAGIIISILNMVVFFILGLTMLVTVPSTVNAVNTAKQRVYCQTAYSCVQKTDGTYNCKYLDSYGEEQDINCEAKYRN